jgi:GNAT superfamily N-acetyltransferase
MACVNLRIERIDPLALDLDTAEEMAGLGDAIARADKIRATSPSGPTRLKLYQHGSDGTPAGGVWTARDGDGRLVGMASAFFPRRENVDIAGVSGGVHPDHRGRGIGRALLDRVRADAAEAGRPKIYSGTMAGTPGEVAMASASFPRRENVDVAGVSGGVHPDHRGRGIGRALLDRVRADAAEAGRTKIYSGTMAGTPGEVAMAALGFETIHTYAISHLDLHGADTDRWDRLYDEAAAASSDYELLRLVGTTPEEQVDDVVALFAAINDAPMTDPDAEPDVWDADRVRGYDAAMAARRQTVYRVMARHRGTGTWAGHSVLCVDEFDPAIGHQEDTSVVGAHRGHRLGLRLKIEMLRWIAEERPEVRATETWNSAENHHMLAVNERLGTEVVDRHLSMRLA